MTTPPAAAPDQPAQHLLDEALSLARGLAGRPLTEHAGGLEDAHRMLAEALATLDQA